MDLYRLSGEEQDLVPLNLDQILEEDVSLIEWPQRLGNKIPTKRLDVTLRIVVDGTEGNGVYDETCQPRRVTLTPVGQTWEDRLQILQTEGYIDDWIEMDSA
jgi:tRNA threonylcarbamoyladenosine biosynthesis protein TsaE